MPVDLSIKRVPDALAERLRRRARKHHRSVQGELMAILQDALVPPAPVSVVRERPPAASEYAPHVTSSSDIAPRSEAALMIREDRDGKSFTLLDLHEYVRSLGLGTPAEATGWIRKQRSSR